MLQITAVIYVLNFLIFMHIEFIVAVKTSLK